MKKVATAAMRATRTRGEAIAPAPLDAGALVAAADTTEAVEEAAAAVDEGALAAVAPPALAKAAATSKGSIKGVEPMLLMSMVPSSCSSSGLLARRLRVNRMFSAAAVCAQSGREAILMLEPHDAALEPSVALSVNAW